MNPSGTGGNAVGTDALDAVEASDNGLALLERVSSTGVASESLRESRESLLSRTLALTELVSRVASSSTPLQACQILADDLAAYLECKQVVVALCPASRTHCQVSAVSGKQDVDVQSEHTRLAAGVLQESVARDELSSWPPDTVNNRHALLAHRQFAEHAGVRCVVSTPLRDEAGVVRGACLLIGDLALKNDNVRTFLQAAAQPLGSALGLLVRAQGNRIERAIHLALDSLQGRKSVAVLAGLVLCSVILMFPMRYRVSCDCELQPIVRRFVAAPFEGRLETSFVEPGDLVDADQVLARIDDHDLTWELSGKKAELHRVAKERAGYLAAHQSGKVEIATLEFERLQLEIDQLEDQVAHLDIRSPIVGMVVLGDLSKSEGVPLEKGQTLFEIAPLERMVIEVAVPEDDVRFIKAGMNTRVRLDAYPMQSMDGVIERVHPRSELKHHDNVFIAELNIENTQGLLRPGMRGTAKIATVRRPLAWILFHKAVAASLMWMGW